MDIEYIYVLLAGAIGSFPKFDDFVY